MKYIKLITGCYFLISSVDKVFTDDSFLFVHNLSQEYIYYKAILVVIEFLIGISILINKNSRKSMLAGILFVLPAFIVAFLNFVFFSNLNCEIGYLSGSSLSHLIQKSFIIYMLTALLRGKLFPNSIFEKMT